MHRVGKKAGVIDIDFSEGGTDVVWVNVFDMRDYYVQHSDRFKVEYGDDWLGPLVAAFLGRPYSPDEWSEARAQLFWDIVASEVAALKKPVPASATSGPPGSPTA